VSSALFKTRLPFFLKLKRRAGSLVGLFYAMSLLTGFALTRVGTSSWDTAAHRDHMRWLVGKWEGKDLALPYEEMQWAGPLWEYVLAVFDAAFRFLNDPLCVRHAVTFTLLPVTLAGTVFLLCKAGETRGTALLAAALLLGNVRFVGHSILNVKDFPLACDYLLCTLLMWSLLHQKMATPAGLLSRPGWLFLLTVLSVLPYLMEAPVLNHWVLLCALCVHVALWESPGLTRQQRWLGALLPLVSGPLLVWALWPPLRDTGIRGFAASFTLFSRFPWRGTVRLFGQTYLASELPRWYAPVWIPLSWEPVGLSLLAIGAVAFFFVVVRDLLRYRSPSVAVLLDSLPVWASLFAVAPWAAVLALRPVLYDEERHILFAMPLLAVCAALGLRRLAEGTKVALAALILVSTLYSLASWGKYSYVYRNPLLGTAGQDFKDDYWGVSSGAMAQALYDHVPDGAYVVVAALAEPITLELERRETSRLFRAGPSKRWRLELKGPASGEFYVVATNRNGTNRRILEDIAAGRARELWRDEMPAGDPAAVLAFYTEPCGHCRLKVRRL